MSPLLSVSDLHVRFANGTDNHHQHSHIAVDGVSFDIYPGERMALVGESGSGKTVTALSILRLLPDATTTGSIQWSPTLHPDRPTSDLDLLNCSERQIRAIRGRDIAMVFQEPMSALNPLLTVGQQIAEVLELHEGLSTKAALSKAVDLLDRTGVDEPQRRAQSYPHQLSGGQRQRVVIAMALACNPKLLIADEPTTALDVTIREQVLELLLDLQRDEGMAILLITHDLPLVQRFAQRVGVMQLGKLVEQGTTESIFTAPQHDYTKKLLASRPKRMVGESVSRDVILSARGVNATFEIPSGWFSKRKFMAVDNEALTLSKGETLGIVGESGSGKTTFGMALLQLSGALVKGGVQFDGKSIYQQSKAELRRLRRRMQVVFQDPFSALSPRMTIGQILGEGLELHFPELDRAQRESRIAEMLEEVGLPANSIGRYPHEFSGGQRQRIAIARAVILQPDFVLLDEPTSALDVSIQQQVLELLVRLQQKHGMAYLFITHDLAVIKAIAHRVMVMRNGRVIETGYTEELLSKPREEYTWRLVKSSAV
jgi:microcin C transport system ATP-binding protein